MTSFRVRPPGIFIALAVSLACGQTSAEPANPRSGPFTTSSWVGSNYTLAYASNQVQVWHDFGPEVIDKELAAAQRYFAERKATTRHVSTSWLEEALR
jgi:hypothetical protein